MKPSAPLLFIILISLSGCFLKPSPPGSVSETTGTGVTISVDYSRPGIKGRTIGKEIAPWGQVWRTGANMATVFEVDKDVTIEGQALPAGKYSLYSIPGQKEWTVILNKSWDQSGTIYDQTKDALRFTVPTERTNESKERLTFEIDKSGMVSLLWGNYLVKFRVE